MNFEATVAVHAPTFNCPNCNHEIKLTKSLAAPLIEENRKRFQEQLASKDAEVAKKTEALRKEQEELATAREKLEDQVNTRLQAEWCHGARGEASKIHISICVTGKARRSATPVRGLEIRSSSVTGPRLFGPSQSLARTREPGSRGSRLAILISIASISIARHLEPARTPRAIGELLSDPDYSTLIQPFRCC